MSSGSEVPGLMLNNGLRVPSLGMGTAQGNAKVDFQLIERAVKDAIDIGYRHFDSAALYGSEIPVGNAIRDKISEGVIKRDRVFVTTKLWCNSMRKDLVVPSLKRSLQNLGLEYVDLYLVHWPIAMKESDTIEPLPGPDISPPPYSDVDYVDTWTQMEECVELGITKSIGVSNFNSQQLQRVMDKCRIKPVVNQVECHPYFNQAKLIEFCRKRDVRITAYSPLGAYKSKAMLWDTTREVLENDLLRQVAQKYGKTPAQIALRWQMQRHVIAIPKSNSKEELEENFNIFNFEISEMDMDEINSISTGRRIFHYNWFKEHPHYPYGIEF